MLAAKPEDLMTQIVDPHDPQGGTLDLAITSCFLTSITIVWSKYISICIKQINKYK